MAYRVRATVGRLVRAGTLALMAGVGCAALSAPAEAAGWSGGHAGGGYAGRGHGGYAGGGHGGYVGGHGGGGWAGPEGNDRLEWVSLAAPFFLGAAGVLALDATVGMQFILFGEGEEKIIKDEEGHWQKVTGWMRGWVPSISARNGESESESESAEREVLLSRNGEAYGSI